MIERRLSIAEVAKRVGRSVSTLHRLERKGLLPGPERNIHGWRAYTEADVEKIIEILNTYTEPKAS